MSTQRQQECFATHVWWLHSFHLDKISWIQSTSREFWDKYNTLSKMFHVLLQVLWGVAAQKGYANGFSGISDPWCQQQTLVYYTLVVVINPNWFEVPPWPKHCPFACIKLLFHQDGGLQQRNNFYKTALEMGIKHLLNIFLFFVCLVDRTILW